MDQLQLRRRSLAAAAAAAALPAAGAQSTPQFRDECLAAEEMLHGFANQNRRNPNVHECTECTNQNVQLQSCVTALGLG